MAVASPNILVALVVLFFSSSQAHAFGRFRRAEQDDDNLGHHGHRLQPPVHPCTPQVTITKTVPFSSLLPSNLGSHTTGFLSNPGSPPASPTIGLHGGENDTVLTVTETFTLTVAGSVYTIPATRVTIPGSIVTITGTTITVTDTQPALPQSSLGSQESTLPKPSPPPPASSSSLATTPPASLPPLLSTPGLHYGNTTSAEVIPSASASTGTVVKFTPEAPGATANSRTITVVTVTPGVPSVGSIGSSVSSVSSSIHTIVIGTTQVPTACGPVTETIFDTVTRTIGQSDSTPVPVGSQAEGVSLPAVPSAPIAVTYISSGAKSDVAHSESAADDVSLIVILPTLTTIIVHTTAVVSELDPNITRRPGEIGGDGGGLNRSD